jgi:ribosome-associated toxin RatA of RatAB toxin-antitoxin module
MLAVMSNRLFLAGLLLAAAVSSAAAGDTRVSVARSERGVIVDAVIVTPVGLRETWDVMTDFDAMSGFLPYLKSSRVTARDGALLRVEQRGALTWGPIARDFATVRQVELTPYERVQSRVIEGDVRRVDTVTRFRALGEQTEVRHHVEISLDSGIPTALVETFLRREVREQFDAFLREMDRRAFAR